jgi:small subunit ribosomal protein S8
MVTDPIADMLVRLSNASRVGKSAVPVPFSALKLAIAEILAREGYVGELDKKKKNELVIPLKYADGRPVISGVKRLSKPSRRLYMGVHDIHPVKRGKGLLILSTPAGVVSGKEAKLKRVGGEALFEIW